MPKEKRIYHAEAVAPPTLQLRRTPPADEKQLAQYDQSLPKRQTFSVELISRLTERIKKI